jgi:hypothetical protein
MRANDFRRLALALPEVEESEHHDHPDFRIGGKVFASLGPKGDWAMVKVPLEVQAQLVRDHAADISAFAGAWGARGCTRLVLAKLLPATVAPALSAAWRETASAKLRKLHPHV